MPPRPLLRRRTCVSAVLLGLQMAVAVAVPLADGRIEAAAVDLPTHVETPGGGTHPPGHDHFRCQLCRVTGASLLVPGATVFLHGLRGERHVPAPHAREAFPSGARLRPLGPRAPPIA